MCVVESVDKFRETRIFCPPHIHSGKHGENVSTFDTTTVRSKQVEDIPWGNSGVKGVQVSEAPDPSVFGDLEDEGPAPHITGSDERLGGKLGGPFSFHIFLDSVGGNARVVQLEGTNHGVKSYGCVKRAF